MTTVSKRTYSTLSKQGLRHDIPPMRLYHKAKKLGAWDPRDIDLTQDKQDWLQFTDEKKERVLRLILGFQAGEEAVTLDLLPLIMTMAREGRLEEEMFLTTFLWEEAKHTEFFRRVLDEAVQEDGDLHEIRSAGYVTQSGNINDIFAHDLPQEMNILLTDPSPVNQLRASIMYNMIIEGVLAETGYYSFSNMLDQNDTMPGLRQGLRLIQRDESRHIAYGIFLISRLVAEHKELWPIVEGRMHELFSEVEKNQERNGTPEKTREYAHMQFQKRLTRIARAKDMSLEQVYKIADDSIEVE